MTNAQYAGCVAAFAALRRPLSYSFSRSSSYGNTEFDYYPVIYVSWYDAANYCTWVGKHLQARQNGRRPPAAHLSALSPWGDGTPDGSLANFYYTVTSSCCVGDTSQVDSYLIGALFPIWRIEHGR